MVWRVANTAKQLSFQVVAVAPSDTPLREGDRKLKFTKVHNFCNHLSTPTKNED